MLKTVLPHFIFCRLRIVFQTVGLAGLYLTLSALPVMAEVLVTPKISLRSAYYDNLFLKDIEDLEYRINPSLLIEKSTERTKARAGIDVTRFQYEKAQKYNRTNVGLNAGLEHNLTERLSTFVRGNWLEDHAVEDYLDEVGQLKNNAKRHSYSVAPGFSYKLTELDTLSLSGSYASMRYQESGAFTDYDMWGATADWQHTLIEGTLALLGRAGWQIYDFDSSGSTTIQNSYTAMAGFSWAPLEKLTLQVLAGVNIIDSDVQFSQSQEKLTSRETGLTESIAATWKEEAWSAGVTVEQAQSPSLYGELSTKNTYRVNLSRSHTERWRTFATIAYETNKTDGFVSRTSRETWNFSAGTAYNLTKDLRCSLQFNHIDNINNLTEKNMSGNSIALQFMWEFPETFD